MESVEDLKEMLCNIQKVQRLRGFASNVAASLMQIAMEKDGKADLEYLSKLREIKDASKIKVKELEPLRPSTIIYNDEFYQLTEAFMAYLPFINIDIDFEELEKVLEEKKEKEEENV